MAHENPSRIAKYCDLFERMLDPTFLIDPQDHRIIEANPASEKLFSIPIEKVIGRAMSDFVIESSREEFSKALRVAHRRYHPRLFETVFRSSDALLTMEMLGCPLRLADGRDILQLIARDITFRRESEKRTQMLIQQLQAVNEKLELLSTQDEMTGLWNFRSLKAQLEQEHTRSSRYGGSYSIVFFDVDHFKQYNDRNGHPAGDALLRELAGILQASSRNTDICARYGGEEFVILCPGVAWEGAHMLAERVRSVVEQHPFAHREKQPMGAVTVSVGIAGYPHDGATAQEVLKAADDALYHSKRTGRNRVSSASAITASQASQPAAAKKVA